MEKTEFIYLFVVVVELCLVRTMVRVRVSFE